MKPKDIQAIEKLVQSTLGFDAARGDVVTVTARPFTDTTPPEQPWYEIDVQDNTWIPDVAKIGAALAVFALVFFMVLRPFMKKAMEVPAHTPSIPGALGQPILLNPGYDAAMEAIRKKRRTRGSAEERRGGQECVS